MQRLSKKNAKGKAGWEGTTMTRPYITTTLVRMNGGKCFEIIITHTPNRNNMLSIYLRLHKEKLGENGSHGPTNSSIQ